MVQPDGVMFKTAYADRSQLETEGVYIADSFTDVALKMHACV